MALRDTWHRTLMYFGLADDEEYEDDIEPYTEPEAEAQHAYSDRPNVRRPSSRRRRAAAGFRASDRFQCMQVGLIGAGNMARALARGWGDPVLVSDNGSGRARELARELGGKALKSNVRVAERADLVVLCHKPTQFLA